MSGETKYSSDFDTAILCSTHCSSVMGIITYAVVSKTPSQTLNVTLTIDKGDPITYS